MNITGCILSGSSGQATDMPLNVARVGWSSDFMCLLPSFRDAWGRLQRLSGGSAYKPTHGLLHPPPFGAAPGTAFRSASSEE